MPRSWVEVTYSGNARLMRTAPGPGGGMQTYPTHPTHYLLRTSYGWFHSAFEDNLWAVQDVEAARKFGTAEDARLAAQQSPLVLPWINWEIVPVWPED